MTKQATPASALAIRTPVRGWRAAFPPAQWLAAYRAQWLPRDAVWAKIRSVTGPLKLVVCDLSISPAVDLAGVRMLATLHKELQAAGIRLRLVAAHAAVRDILRAEGLEESVGYFGRRISVADVIDEFQSGTGTAAGS